MLTRIHVENFKSLKDVSIELKPLTIFIGPNSAGKSSILQSILVLKKLYVTQGSIPLSNLFQLDSYINMGFWDDVTFYEGKPMRIALSISEGDLVMHLNAVLYRESKVDLDAKLIIEGVENELRKTIALPYSQKQPHGISIKTKEGALSANWDGFNISITSVSGLISEILKSLIIPLLSGWHYRVFFVPSTISMLRQPQITVPTQTKDTIMDNVRKQLLIGEDLLVSLIALDSNIEDYVIRCTREIFGTEIRARPFPQNVCKIISSIRKGKTVPIVNEGGGINRNVYMFTVLALADEGSTILIEEPETNLHPSAQYNLAKILVEAVRQERKQLLITTHSEHLLFGVLRHVSEKKIDLNEIAIYYVQKSEAGETSLNALEIDQHGRVKGGLPGFFEEEVKELIDMLST